MAIVLSLTCTITTATNVEGIFRLSGSEKRIKELKTIFDSPDRYGKGLDWAGYTVHDAANVLRRYLNLLPEPIVPLDLYARFREPLRGHTMAAVGDSEGGPQFSDNFDVNQAIITYQQLITELPPLNRQLLLYILDLLAVFASKSDENRMTAVNLAAIFQPGMLSHPEHDMAPAEYRLSQDVLIFLIENQDHFLIGMRGTAADEQTVHEVQNGTPPPGTPTTPARSKTTIGRSASNASAGAESIRKYGGIRRNVSVSSRHSRQSNGAPSPASPAYGGNLTHSSSVGVHRSNTVPSKKSPGLPSNRINKNSGPPSPIPMGLTTNRPAIPQSLTPGIPPSPSHLSPSPPGLAINTTTAPSLANSAHTVTSEERLLPESNDKVPEVSTPSRIVSNLFQRSPPESADRRPPNKLRKKRLPSSSNPSAQSSTNSLNARSSSVSPGLRASRIGSDPGEHPHLEHFSALNPILSNTQPTPPATETPRAEQHPQFTQTRPEDPHHPSERTLKPLASPVSSLHSHSSFNDQSDLDHLDDLTLDEAREKRARWNRSRRQDDSAALGATLSSRKGESDSGAGASSSSVGSSRPRKSFTGDTVPLGPDSGLPHAHPFSSNESGSGFHEEKKGPFGWIKNRMREKREESREKGDSRERNKSPCSSTDRPTNISTSALAPRGKSIELIREGGSAERHNERGHPMPQQ
ncbi:GTPase activating protein (GAP) for Rho1p [Clarireedia jacksonii]